MYVLKTEQMKVPLKVWAEKESVEAQCLEQMERVSSLPFLHKHVALMPDAHLGEGASIGSVVATSAVILPALVGVDIGCGMCAVKTSLTEIDTETLKEIMGKIRKAVPVGFSKHKEAQDRSLMPDLFLLTTETNRDGGKVVVADEYINARKSIGTLGGGNHFIEIQKGSDGYIWIMIHSGSRNLGFKVAKYYNDIAKVLNKKWHSQIPQDWGLAFLPVDSEEGQAYIREMNYCVEFAFANRKLMMDRICEIFFKEFGVEDRDELGHIQSMDMVGIEFDDMINIAHNYAAQENHFGDNVWVHRKGATRAYEGEIGIIPGSQGTKSYIVKGKGNPDSFKSCSHGAGRLLSRTKARDELSVENEKKKLDDMGVIHSIRGKKDLDEAPSAYKNIDVVMKNQKDLVDILVELTPLAVIKG